MLVPQLVHQRKDQEAPRQALVAVVELREKRKDVFLGWHHQVSAYLLVGLQRVNVQVAVLYGEGAVGQDVLGLC